MGRKPFIILTGMLFAVAMFGCRHTDTNRSARRTNRQDPLRQQAANGWRHQPGATNTPQNTGGNPQYSNQRPTTGYSQTNANQFGQQQTTTKETTHFPRTTGQTQVGQYYQSPTNKSTFPSYQPKIGVGGRGPIQPVSGINPPANPYNQRKGYQVPANNFRFGQQPDFPANRQSVIGQSQGSSGNIPMPSAPQSNGVVGGQTIQTQQQLPALPPDLDFQQPIQQYPR